jgi:hypothetical protein
MLAFCRKIQMSFRMAEEKDLGSRSRWSLGAFIKLEAVLIAAATILLYMQALIYVEAFCDGLGIRREAFVFSFSDAALFAWGHLAGQGLIYGPIVVSLLFGVPAVVAFGELILFWVLRNGRANKQRRIGRPESRQERRISIQAEDRWYALLKAVVTMIVAFGLFRHSFNEAIFTAQKEARARLENKTVSTVLLKAGTSRQLIFLTRLGDSYAFIQPGAETSRRYVIFSSAEFTSIEFSRNEPMQK